VPLRTEKKRRAARFLAGFLAGEILPDGGGRRRRTKEDSRFSKGLIISDAGGRKHVHHTGSSIANPNPEQWPSGK
jgi:hypothetical protein